jgi:hypothetical protein
VGHFHARTSRTRYRGAGHLHTRRRRRRHMNPRSGALAAAGSIVVEPDLKRLAAAA